MKRCTCALVVVGLEHCLTMSRCTNHIVRCVTPTAFQLFPQLKVVVFFVFFKRKLDDKFSEITTWTGLTQK